MKKVLTLAVVATLFLTGSVFAQFGRHVVAEPNATFAFGVGGAAAGPSTTNNDDTCDIGTAPAATLLLPYFEVDTTAARGLDTFFTVTNVSNLPQIAHVVVWTDWSFPVLDFNIFLTGYDVQSISLYDVIVNGIIAPTNAQLTAGGTSSNTTPGQISAANTANPNITDLSGCANLPGFIPGSLRTAMLTALTTGSGAAFGCTTSTGAARQIGGNHGANTAIGYVTVDVVNNCSLSLHSAGYFNTEILFDNVLTGDYQFINKTTGNNYLGANPLVHIRAVPEGGPAGTAPFGALNPTNFPYTFYTRYLAGTNPVQDRRQPLPSVFAARFIQGGVNAQNTNFKIWREGPTGNPALTGCLPSHTGPFASANAAIPVTEIVRFDAHENPNTYVPGVVISPPITTPVNFPETSRTSTASGAQGVAPPTFNPGATFPPLVSPSGDDNGWMYLNLNAFGAAPLVTGSGPVRPGFTGARASQNWVVVEFTGTGSTAGVFGGEFDATWLGNGCSGAVASTNLNTAGIIGPVGGTPVCPQGSVRCTTTATTYTNTTTGQTVNQVGTNTTP